MNQTTNIIYCKGRYSADGRTPCTFEHIGHWGDKELVEHQKEEEAKDTKKEWWIGFDTDRKFENLKTKVEEVYDERKD